MATSPRKRTSSKPPASKRTASKRTTSAQAARRDAVVPGRRRGATSTIRSICHGSICWSSTRRRAGCRPRLLTRSSSRSAASTDDSQAVEQYDGTLGVTTAFVNAHQKPAVQVQWNDNLATIYTNPGDVNGVRWGSGTMISADLLLTCGHLFDADPQRVDRAAPERHEHRHLAAGDRAPTCTSTSTLPGRLHRQRCAPSRASRSPQLIEYRLGGLDMAICRIGGNPGNTFGFSEVSTTNPAVGDMLCDHRTPGGPAEADRGRTVHDDLRRPRSRYNDIDTLGGNSGSGILQASTDASSASTPTAAATPRRPGGSNSGTAIAAIHNVSPTLQALPGGSRTANADDILVTHSPATSATRSRRRTRSVRSISSRRGSVPTSSGR